MFEHRRLLTQLSVPLAALLLTTACVNWLSHGELESFTVWKELASEVRELPFLEQVGSRWISREELRQIVKEELQAEYAAEYVESYRDAYAAMGLLPPGLDLLEVLLDLLQDQLGSRRWVFRDDRHSRTCARIAASTLSRDPAAPAEAARQR
jgi:hypothetical protein